MVTDINMPNRNVFPTAAETGEDDKLAHLPVLWQTARSAASALGRVTSSNLHQGDSEEKVTLTGMMGYMDDTPDKTAALATADDAHHTRSFC